uniref:cyclic AMP-dependent transcription factor ATF-1-like n=1 Tax=Styela clava TaxID=7725 RepID=UPI001939BA64|nr:cyclic AMP-dependent transcription factor ATF-1-like [Styela clava]
MEAVLHGPESNQKLFEGNKIQQSAAEQVQLQASVTEARSQMVSFSQPENKSEPSSKVHSVITANPSLAENEQEGKASLNPAEGAKRREVLSRRPSYRRILNDLSSTDVIQQTENIEQQIVKVDSENAGLKMPIVSEVKPSQNLLSDDNSALFDNTDDNDANSPQMIHVPAADINTISNSIGSLQNTAATLQNTVTIPGIQGFTMANQSPMLADNNQPGSMWLPGSHVVVQTVGGGMQAFQIQDNASSPGAGMMQTSRNLMQNNIQSPQQMAEDASRKREMRLMKNRDAAKECRRRKKEYVKCLETRVAVLEHQNKQLIDELKTLKELYVHKQVDTG